MAKSARRGASALFVLAIGLAVIIPPGLVFAKPAITDCGSKPGISNPEWQKCEADFISKDKVALHKAEDDLAAAIPKASQSDFREEEAAWSAYAAKACRFYFNGDWGRDGQVVHGPLCIDGVIVARTKELRSLVKFLTHYEQAP